MRRSKRSICLSQRSYRRYLHIVEKINDNPSSLNRFRDRKLRRIAELLCYVGEHRSAECSHESALIALVSARKISTQTLYWVWDNVANPKVQDAILTSEMLHETTKVQLALERLNNPSRIVYSW